MMPTASMASLLRRLTAAADPDHLGAPDLVHLDRRSAALVRIGAAVCQGAPAATFVRLVDAARDTGASDDDILGAFLCVAAMAGESRLVAGAPHVANALGYDIERAFELG